jgi:hypothetical protein
MVRAVVFMFEEHFLFGMLRDTEPARYYSDLRYRLECHVRANNELEATLGYRPYREDRLVYMKGALEVRLGTRRVLNDHGAWLHPAIDEISDVSRWIADTDGLDLRAQPVPDRWRSEAESFSAATGKSVTFRPSVTGPVTLAGALLGPTNLCLWAMLEPETMSDFFSVLGSKQIEFYEGLAMEEDGAVEREGIGVNDDLCSLFSPELYERLCVPYLERLFRAFAPRPDHRRRQHSDSGMAHLLPQLRDLGVNEVNVAPDAHPAEIRASMPEARIHGQMHPLLLRNGTPLEIEESVRRDAETLVGTPWMPGPVGVVAAGTSPRNLRTYIEAVATGP